MGARDNIVPFLATIDGENVLPPGQGGDGDGDGDGDISASEVINDSSVSGADVAAALDALASRKISVPLPFAVWPGQQGSNANLNWGLFRQRNVRSALLPGVVDGLSAVIRIPDQADITQPAVLQYEYSLGNSAASGDVVIVTYRALVSDGDRFNGSETPSTIDVDQIAIPANSNLQRQRRSVNLTISNAIPGDSMGIAIERRGAQDTFPNAFVILQSAYVEFTELVP